MEEKPSNQQSGKSEFPTIVKNLLSDSKNFTPSNNNLIRTKDIKDIKDLSKQEKGI